MLTVTVLTGGRPDLLDVTLWSTVDKCPGLLEQAKLIVLVNGGDQATLDVVDDYQHLIDRLEVHDGPLLPIGEAVTRLARLVPDRGLWLHLEDDWQACDDPGWLERAVEILDAHPKVGQVRLRRDDEPVLSRHMVTHEPIRWQMRAGWKLSRDAHYTLNPSLIRAADAPLVWPASGERAAQRRWWQAGRRQVAQLIPGVWSHVGGGESLRQVTRCEP